MSILTIRTALREAGIPGADTATMSLGPMDTQWYRVGDREIGRPADESSGDTAVALVAELKV